MYAVLPGILSRMIRCIVGALDELLMVQGWRRMNGSIGPVWNRFELKYLPEQGIELHGR